MRKIDMSAQAITARLRLVSELRRLCLLLGSSEPRTKTITNDGQIKQSQQIPSASKDTSK
jgi:hypothetical protein